MACKFLLFLNMPIDEKQLGKFLLDTGLITAENLAAAEKLAGQEKISMLTAIGKGGWVKGEDMSKAKAHVMGVPFVDLKEIEIKTEVLQTIPENVARQYKAVAFERQGKKLKVAMLDPNDLQFIDFLSKKTGFTIIPCLAEEEGIRRALKQFQKSLQAEFGDLVGAAPEEGELVISQDGGKEGEEDGGLDLRKAAEDLPVVKIVDTLLKHAILENASDIHIEPEEKSVIIRYRVDGVLRDAMKLPREVLAGIVARIKVLANLKIDEHRLPQDGRFKVESADYKVAFRVSIIPVFDGEKIVMRLLNESQEVLSLEQMGFRKRDFEVIQREIAKPNGMILVVGPTGSGKTTTLYTILGILNQPDVNISTLEDPVEYRMPRVNQSQINSKINFTFASGLRALLRQDPDIIMVGEIRDGETAELAVHAALTGHLVLSTLHTSSAAGTLPRITDMGIENFLLASTANVIVSQRLVRRTCAACLEKYQMDEGLYETFITHFDAERLAKLLQDEGLISGNFGSVKDLWMSVQFSKGKGCGKCRGGYKGRMGVYEILPVTDEIKHLISEGATTETIEEAGVKEGMTTMLEDGIIKAVQGVTTLEEVVRVTKE